MGGTGSKNGTGVEIAPAFEEQLIGMKNGEKKEIKVVFPEDYHEKKFAGKEIIFNVTLKNIKENP